MAIGFALPSSKTSRSTLNLMPRSLPRELTYVSATMIVVANMIGTGIFTTTGFLAGDLGRPWVVLGVWVAGALVALAGCLCYAELAINLPHAGGEYVYLREAWGPVWGFLSGWISFFAGFSAPVAAAALAFSEYLSYFYTPLSVSASTGRPLGLFHIKYGFGQWLAIAVVAGFGAVNILGLRLAARLQNILTSLKLGVLLTFLVLTFTTGKGNFQHFSHPALRASTHSLVAQFAVSLIFVMFAYSGWNAATYVTEEIKTPESTLPASLVTGTLLVALFYLALNVAFIYAMPLEKMKGVVRVGGAAAAALFGSRGGGLFSAMMAVGLLSCVSAMMIVGPRVYYAMAKDGCFFRGAALLHPRWLTPVQAILYQSAAAAALILTGTFEGLIYYIGFALIMFAALATAGLVRLRRRAGWKSLPAVEWGYPLLPALFMAASVWMLLYTAALRPRESLLGLLTMLAGGFAYRWVRR